MYTRADPRSPPDSSAVPIDGSIPSFLNDFFNMRDKIGVLNQRAADLADRLVGPEPTKENSLLGSSTPPAASHMDNMRYFVKDADSILNDLDRNLSRLGQAI